MRPRDRRIPDGIEPSATVILAQSSLHSSLPLSIMAALVAAIHVDLRDTPEDDNLKRFART
jgi:hypothetical protein